MKPEEIFADKTIRQKAKAQMLAEMLSTKKLKVSVLMEFAERSAEAEKASCMEALEAVTRKDPGVADESCLKYLVKTLREDAPRVKWESAKAIGNIAHLYPDKLKTAIVNLLNNAESERVVVRWASAYALGEILKLRTKHNRQLLSTLQALADKESDNGVRKKYLEAIKKVSG